MDRVEWTLDSSRTFTIKKLKEEIEKVGSNTNRNSEPTKWLKIIPKKVCVFIWRVSKGRIPCTSILDHMGIDLDSVLCPCCGEVAESLEHALISCSEVKKLWTAIRKWWRKNPENSDSVRDLLCKGANEINVGGLDL